ncbi:UDP-N-acetylmuramate--L-alanine ligase [Spirochaeta lutea]|uniref:UDP-N-acetylmuramate--L-alanine ligase n=1 Tax=Spirochaeta lutea TaxID=1480694 RepID=UPI00056BDD33|nr:UDP-N-acetylmuramate--L-alanine ligase [Spirochaeta lutea]
MKYFPEDLRDFPIYCVGIKGTGMTALAELLLHRGAQISGSDTPDIFYTDQILKELGIPVFEGFSADNLPPEASLVIYSAAYDPANHPELLRAKELGIPCIGYTQALGDFSSLGDSSAVAGVHGKTTTAGMVGSIIKGLGLDGSVLVGSGVSSFGGRSTWAGGEGFFVAETCEYRRHFLHFSPRRILLTSAELDHPDYFRDLEDLYQAFLEFIQRLPEGGQLIYCTDDPGALEIARRAAELRHDIASIPYGFTAEGPFRITDHEVSQGFQRFNLSGMPLSASRGQGPRHYSIRIPGKHSVLNAAGALALIFGIYADLYGNLSPDLLSSAAVALSTFGGTTRRSEVIGEAQGILVLDDYGHHPSAIRSTLQGFKEFYPGRRLVVSFMPHTYSRTAALFQEFARCFESADRLILHDVYASARETPLQDYSGRALFEAVQNHHPDVIYLPRIEEAFLPVRSMLTPGDVLVTMGAGDNWKLGRRIYDSLVSDGTKNGRG